MSGRGSGDRTLPDQNAASASLARFIDQLAEIAPGSDEAISAHTHLVDDLGFDESDFGRLASLLYERYGIGGLSAESLPKHQHLTVAGFFQHCVLDVLGIRLGGGPGPPIDAARGRSRPDRGRSRGYP